MKKTIKTLLLTSILGLASGAQAENYTIGTGSQSGTYYPYGGVSGKNLER